MAASGAKIAGRLAKTAVVAKDTSLFEMKSHGDAAVRTTQDKTAKAALEKIGEAPAVKKNQALLVPAEVFLERLHQS
jgi:hypothetical protein